MADTTKSLAAKIALVTGGSRGIGAAVCQRLAAAGAQVTITTDRWLTGAATLQHFSRFYVFLGCPFSHARWQVWACIIRHAAPLIPAEAPIVIEFDDTTKKKAGRPIEGMAYDCNGAGSAGKNIASCGA